MSMKADLHDAGDGNFTWAILGERNKPIAIGATTKRALPALLRLIEADAGTLGGEAGAVLMQLHGNPDAWRHKLRAAKPVEAPPPVEVPKKALKRAAAVAPTQTRSRGARRSAL